MPDLEVALRWGLRWTEEGPNVTVGSVSLSLSVQPPKVTS
ncbi:hypothetical protein [Shigella phage ESh6]|nr:hypothetical protein [Shigella phage ESh6]